LFKSRTTWYIITTAKKFIWALFEKSLHLWEFHNTAYAIDRAVRTMLFENENCSLADKVLCYIFINFLFSDWNFRKHIVDNNKRDLIFQSLDRITNVVSVGREDLSWEYCACLVGLELFWWDFVLLCRTSRGELNDLYLKVLVNWWGWKWMKS
jgi:hypothetical protein